MMKENDISSRQMTRMLYIEGFGAAGLTLPAVASRVGPGEGWLSFLAYGLMLLLFTCYLFKMGKERGDTPFPAWAAMIYGVRIFINVTVLFYYFGLSVHNIYMPDHDLKWLLIPAACLIWYCGQASLQKHMRFTELVFPWAAVMFGLIIFMACAGIMTKINTLSDAVRFFAGKGALPDEITHFMRSPQKVLWGGYLLLLCTTPLEAVYWLVPHCTFQKPWSCVSRGVAGGYLCNVLLWLVTVKTLGSALTASTLWPVVKIMQLIHLPGGFLERFDILLAVYWILCMVCVLSGYLCYGRRMLEGFVSLSFPRPMSSDPKRKRKIMALGMGTVAFAIYFLACLPWDQAAVLKYYIYYKALIDLPLILLMPVILRFRKAIKEKTGLSRTCVSLFLLTVLVIPLCGCRKQSDAEKKNYVLSLYAEISGDHYIFDTAAAELSKMKEKESYFPCSSRRTTADSLRDLEKQLYRTQTGQPEWNHIDTIMIGPELSKRPGRLIRFLREWDASWQNSPAVTVCLADCSYGELSALAEKETNLPDGSAGQEVKELIDQIDKPGSVCRSPIDILKKYYEGEKDIVLYHVKIKKRGLYVYSSRWLSYNPPPGSFGISLQASGAYSD